jgi:hypothetical protein
MSARRPPWSRGCARSRPSRLGNAGQRTRLTACRSPGVKAPSSAEILTLGRHGHTFRSLNEVSNSVRHPGRSAANGPSCTLVRVGAAEWGHRHDSDSRMACPLRAPSRPTRACPLDHAADAARLPSRCPHRDRQRCDPTRAPPRTKAPLRVRAGGRRGEPGMPAPARGTYGTEVPSVRHGREMDPLTDDLGLADAPPLGRPSPGRSPVGPTSLRQVVRPYPQLLPGAPCPEPQHKHCGRQHPDQAVAFSLFPSVAFPLLLG